MNIAPDPTPSDGDRRLDEIERQWQVDLIPDVPAVAVLVANARGEVLLQLRDDDPRIEFADHWTLPGGRVEAGETAEQAAHRELEEETGLRIPLSRWKVYRRRHTRRTFWIEQHVFLGQTQREADELALGEGQALRYAGRAELAGLRIAYGFDALLNEYFCSR